MFLDRFDQLKKFGNKTEMKFREILKVTSQSLYHVLCISFKDAEVDLEKVLKGTSLGG